MRVMFILLIQLYLLPVCAAEVMSFKDWKDQQIRAAQMTVEVAHVDYKLKRRASPQRPTAGSTGAEMGPPESDGRLNSARVGLEVAKGLSLNDYFVFYLCRVEEKDAFEKALKKLDPAQMQELLNAYKSFVVRKLDAPPVDTLKTSTLPASSSASYPASRTASKRPAL